ncbi:MAG: glycosyltransferase family 39 protein [Hyphomonadaceae bacterium]|nr:glycosyltransferase family 39 protein [Hyphomonadaceae bacterium]
MIDTLLARPERALFALALLQMLFWTLAPALSHSAPPLDVVEMYAWGREGVVATFKHPNLPGLVLEPTRWLTGEAGWPAYLVSQLFVVMTFAAVFALGRAMMDAPRALAGTLLLTGVYFFSWPTPEFNHNVAQMPLWALIALALWQAATTGRWAWWAALGVFAGLSLWAKYSSAIVLVVAAAWILWDEQARRRLFTPGPWIALVAFLAMAAPQAFWLVDSGFAPFAYAARRADVGEWYAAFEFLLTFALQHLPMAIMLLAAGLFGAAAASAPAKPERRALHFLLLLGLGPPLLMAAGALLTGAGIRSPWATPMASLSGLLAVALLSERFTAARLRGLAIGACVMIVVFSTLYFAHMRYGVAFTGKPLRGNWPQAEISAHFEDLWRERTNGAPLRIVAGDIWTAGMIAMDGPNPPSVLINGDLTISPWVSEADLRRDGALVVWSGRQPAALAELIGARQVGQWGFRPANASAMADDIVVYFVLIAPEHLSEAPPPEPLPSSRSER